MRRVRRRVVFAQRSIDIAGRVRGVGVGQAHLVTLARAQQLLRLFDAGEVVRVAPGAFAYRRTSGGARPRKRLCKPVKQAVGAVAGQGAEVRGFGLVVVDDERLRAHEVRIRVGRAVSQRDRHGQLGALVAQVPDPSASKRQVGRVENRGGKLCAEGVEHVAVAK